MNNTLLLRNIFRFLFLLALQVLVLKRVEFADFNYITLFIYPIFLLYLPLRTPTGLMLLLGFFCGLLIDIFYNTVGLHIAACVFSGYIRNGLLAIIEPAGGYKEGVSPTKRRFGFFWFLRYSAIFLFLHILWFFSIEVFTPYYWQQIMVKTLFSFLASMIVVTIYSFVFDPVD
jgi:hypothetical protein